MPGGDRTGHRGFGPMTGRGAGYCAGYPVPGYANPIPGRGWFGYGRGFGRGRGWRHWHYPVGMPGGAGPGFTPWIYPAVPELTNTDEMAMLKNQAEFLKTQLDDIQNQISKLEKDQSQDK